MGGIWGDLANLISVGSRVKLQNIKFEITNNHSPFWGVYAYKVDDLEIRGCEWVNCRLYAKNDESAVHKGLRLIDNKITCDFSAANYTVDQLDPISIYGYKDVKVTGNVIQATNTHRIFKISDITTTMDATPYRAQRIVVSGNIVTGSTTSNKQAMDLFQSTSDIVISGNYFNVTGWSSVINNKDAGMNVTSTTARNLAITNNIMIFDNQGIALQGKAGALTAGYDVGYDNATITGNTLQQTGNPNIAALGVRFHHYAVISGNSITCDEGVNNSSAIAVFSNVSVSVTGNVCKYGRIELARVTTDEGGLQHTGDVGDVAIIGNTVTDHMSSGGIIVTSLALSGIGPNVTISGNAISAAAVNIEGGRPIRLQLSAVKNMSITNNTSINKAGTGDAHILWGYTSIGRDEVRGNSWQSADNEFSVIPVRGVAARGDRCKNIIVAVGQPKGWINVVTGGNYTITRANTTAVDVNIWAKWDSGTTAWESTTAGTTGAAAPSIVGLVVGDTVVDGTVTWTMRSLTAASWISEGNL
jgi:hypothetical protein